MPVFWNKFRIDDLVTWRDDYYATQVVLGRCRTRYGDGPFRVVAVEEIIPAVDYGDGDRIEAAGHTQYVTIERVASEMVAGTEIHPNRYSGAFFRLVERPRGGPALPSWRSVRGALSLVGLLLVAPTLSGCLGAAAGAGALSAATQVPTWYTIVNDAVTGIKTLNEVEQLACTAQTMANSVGDATASYYWGLGCKW